MMAWNDFLASLTLPWRNWARRLPGRGARPKDDRGAPSFGEGVRGQAIFTLDTEGHVATWNEGAQRLLGWPAEEILGQRIDRFYPPETLAAGAPLETLAWARRDGRREEEGWRTRRDGSRFYAGVQVQALRDASGTLLGYGNIVHDLTESKRVEESLRRANRALAARAACYRALTVAQDEPELLARVCKILVEIAGYRMSWAGIARADEERSVEPVASAGYVDGYLEDAQISWGENPRGLGPTGRCLRSGQPVVARSIAGDADFAPWREAALRRGYRSSIALPVSSQGGDRVVLNIYAAEEGAFDAGELTMLSEMACDVAHGLTALRARAAGQRLSEEVRVAEERLRLALSATHQGLYDLDVQSGAVVVSPEYATMLGHDPAEFHETNAAWIAGLHPDDRDRVSAIFHDCLAGRVPEYRVEFRQRTKSGGWKWILSLGKVVEFDAAGRPKRMLGTRTDLDERKGIEEELRQSEQRLRVLFAANPQPMWVYDCETLEIVEVNDAAIAQYGYTRDEFLRLSIRDLRPREDLANLEQHFAAGGAGPAGDAGVWRHRKKAGELIHAHIVTRDIAYDGRACRMVLAEDVTERQRAAETLRRSEERLRLALSAAQQGLYDVDVKSGDAVVSPEYATMLGYDPEEFRETFADWIAGLHPDDRERATGVYHDYIAGLIPEYRVEFRQRTKSGGWKWILSLGKIVEYDAAGRPQRMLGTRTDLDERKRIEEELRQSEASLAMAQEVAGIGSWRRDPATQRGEWSAQMYRLLGRDPALGHPSFEGFLAMVHPEDRLPLRESLEKTFAEGHVVTVDFRGDPELGTRHFRANMKPLTDDKGVTTEVVGTLQDTTEIHRTEETLRELTGSLLRAQDEERRRIARELHDSTAPTLAAISMNLTRLTQTLPAALHGPRRLAEECQQMVLHSGEEIRTLSYLLHPPQLEEQDLAEAMADYADGFSARSGITVRLRLEGSFRGLPADLRLGLFRVLQESLSNVHRHSSSSIVHVRLWREEGRALHLEVRDEGSGFGPARSRTAEDSLKGVGIASMRERMRRLGGRLEIVSSSLGLRVLATVPAPEPSQGGEPPVA